MSGIVAVGAGRMGRGIAQVFAYAGHAVTILDLKERPTAEAARLLGAAKDEVAENLGFLQSLGLIEEADIEPILDLIAGAAYGDAGAVLGEAAFIFEGVPETLDAKEQALGSISALAGDAAIIASTSSTMPSDSLAGFVTGPERFLNAHWLNPAYLIPLVEVSPGPATAQAATDKLMALLEGIGKVPVLCASSPGYIVPRIQAVAMNEAARMVEEGVATPEDIDRAVRAGFGIRYATMGLVEFSDWGGVDILYHASNYLAGKLGPRFTPPAIVAEKMKAGELGLKSGKGFYDFGAIDSDAYRREKLAAFIQLLQYLELMPKPGDRPGDE